MNLFDYVAGRATEVPDRIGFAFEDGREWTYAEFEREAARAASALRQLGAGPGVRVALYMQNSPELAFALLGAWRLGATAVTINVMYRTDELRHAIELTEPVALVADRRNLDVLATLREVLPPTAVAGDGEPPAGTANFGSLCASATPTAEVFDAGEDDEAAILFTGGTTGRPKAVRTTHAGWISALETLARASRGRPGPFAATRPETPPNLVALPLFHSGGQQAFLFAYVAGRSVLLMERFTAERLVELVRQHRIDNLFLLPTMLYDLVRYEGDADLRSVRSVLVSGQELSLALRRRFEERFGIPILQNYGSTEVGHIAGWTGPDLRAGLWKPGSAGRVYEGVKLEIRDEHDRSLPPGEIGEICAFTNVAKGYVDAGDEQLVVKDGWVYTQDMGYLDEDGVLFLVGRSRDLIKCGGFQVWPAEVEEALLRHPLVREVAVAGVPDERMGEIPAALVVPAVELAELDTVAAEQELITFCRSQLAVYKAVREVMFVPALPRSEAGKIKRSELLGLREERFVRQPGGST